MRTRPHHSKTQCLQRRTLRTPNQTGFFVLGGGASMIVKKSLYPQGQWTWGTSIANDLFLQQAPAFPFIRDHGHFDISIFDATLAATGCFQIE